MRISTDLLLIRPGLDGCEHRHLTWGHDPATVTCACGARWRAGRITLVASEENRP